MPGDVGAAAANRVIPLPGPVLRRHRGQEHEVARYPDVVERIVAGLVGTLAAGLLAGNLLDDTLAELFGLGHPGDVVVLGGPAAAGGVAVHLGDAVPIELLGVVIGEPGAAGVTAGRMARPPGDPDRALEGGPVLPEDPGDFEHGAIADGVVADPDIPRVIVPVKQDKRLGLVGALNFHHGDRGDVPAVLQIRDDGADFVAAGGPDDLLAVGIVDRHHRNRRFPRQVVQVRGAPDSGADTPVRILARVHRNNPDGAQRLVVDDLPGHAEPFGDHDPAPYQRVEVRLGRSLEELLEVGVLNVRDVEQRGGPAWRGQAHGHRLGAEAPAPGLDPGRPGQAQVQLGPMDGDGHPQLVESADDLAGGGFDVSGVFPLESGEPFDERPGVVGGDGTKSGTDLGSEHWEPLGITRVTRNCGRDNLRPEWAEFQFGSQISTM